MNQRFNRLIAYPTLVSDIYKHEFRMGAGDWDPNYLDFGYKQVSRIVVVGTIVDNRILESNTVTIDDGSGTIDVREFADDTKKSRLLNSQNIGDIILVIGRIREFNSQRYIMPEIVRKADAEIFKYSVLKAKVDIKKNASRKIIMQVVKEENAESAQKTISEDKNEIIEDSIDDKPIDQIINKSDIIIKIIADEDKGDGVEILEIVEKSMLDDSEKIINDLLASGELFMVKPGRVKIL